MANKIEHLIVLMLENRSFDHLFGYLNHSNSALRKLTGGETNMWAPGAPPAQVSSTASYSMAVDPGHKHGNVLCQLTGLPELHSSPVINNSGFAYDYSLVSIKKGHSAAHGAEIMKCFPSNQLPVLSTLATEFAICDHWFCSVPGATWPNRNFAVSATSDGDVNIKLFKFYQNRTIFELLEEEGRTWRIYYDGIPHLWVFPKLRNKKRRPGFKPIKDLYTSIKSGKLPNFSFIEPRHFGKNSNSQHPQNNIKSGQDFLRGEALIRDIYTALLDNPGVFQKTLFVITYDEHGGYYDHEAPPQGKQFKDGKVYKKGSYRFHFDLLGPRVPAVLVSPYIPARTVISKDLEHSSIVATARALFAPDAKALTPRDQHSGTFHDVCSLLQPRDSGEMPSFPPSSAAMDAEAFMEESELPVSTLDEFQASLLWLADQVEQAINQEESSGPEAAFHDFWKDSTQVQQQNIDTVGQADKYQNHVVNLFRKTIHDLEK